MPDTSSDTLARLAHVVRSKNAGPAQLTIDVFFRDAQAYARAAHSPAMSAHAIASLYSLQPGQVVQYLLPGIAAMKYTMPRRLCAGNPGDGDVYGAQQHAPMLGIVL